MIRQIIADLAGRRPAPPASGPAAATGAAGGEIVQDRPPARAQLRRALVTPGRQRPGRQYSGEVYDADGRLEPLSLRPSARAGYKHLPEPPRRARARLAGRHLYAGPLFGIFGHDLIELPGRLWPLLEQGGARFDGIVVQKFTPGADAVQLRLDATIATVLAAFDIGFQQIHLVEAPTEVEDLTVPEPALAINHFGLPILGDCFRRIAERQAGIAPRLPGRGLYLSRSGTGASRVANEPEIEAAARRAGLQVLHPQRLGLPLQIALMAEAQAIAGTDGSALHLAAFARPGTRLLSFDTRDVVNQRIVNAVAGLDARSVPVAPGGIVQDIDAHLAALTG